MAYDCFKNIVWLLEHCGKELVTDGSLKSGERQPRCNQPYLADNLSDTSFANPVFDNFHQFDET